MAYNKIGGYQAGLHAYDIPSIKDKQQVNVPDPNINTSVDPQLLDQKEQEQEKELSLDVTPLPQRENASIENIAISFGQYDQTSIDLYGERGLASGDMQKAISGMQKDHILHEYQYFVGGKDLTGKENSRIIAGTEDGVAIRL